jgi:hypothetical protein
VQALATNFIPAADQVDRLQRTADADSLFFQQFASQGHTRDVGVRGLGRQGTYAITPSGTMLASVNSPDAQPVIEMMEEALTKWARLPPAERVLATPLDPQAPEQWRWWDKKTPQDGLILWVVCRDLPRADIRETWRFAWGMDHAWFKKEEARKFVPDRLKKGAKENVPRELVERLARFHLVDSVRGRESLAFPKRAVAEARLTAEVTEMKGSRVQLRFEGATRTSEKTDLFPDHPAAQQRGYDATLIGRAVFDRQAERFVSFELVAVGQRRGATSCNMRIQDDDIGPAPMGVVVTLASNSPAHRVPPAFLSQYGGDWGR